MLFIWPCTRQRSFSQVPIVRPYLRRWRFRDIRTSKRK
jgi:hypothetical protein